MKIKKWNLFLEDLRDYDNPPPFNQEQVDWLNHSLLNPLNFVKNFNEFNLEILEDEDSKSDRDSADLLSNSKKIRDNSKVIEDRIKKISATKGK
jgi:hypothetical protein